MNCQYIYGDPSKKDWRFCERPVMEPGKSYCENHFLQCNNTDNPPNWIIVRRAIPMRDLFPEMAKWKKGRGKFSPMPERSEL